MKGGDEEDAEGDEGIFEGAPGPASSAHAASTRAALESRLSALEAILVERDRKIHSLGNRIYTAIAERRQLQYEDDMAYFDA